MRGDDGHELLQLVPLKERKHMWEGFIKSDGMLFVLVKYSTHQQQAKH